MGRAERPLAIDEDIVLGHVVVPAMREDRAKAASTRVTATQKDIPEHGVTAVAIVEVHRGRTVAHGTADVAPEVVADDVAAAGRVAAFVQCPGVVAGSADVMDDVQFKDVVVSLDADGHVRCIVNPVVGGAIADTAKCNAAGIRELMLREPPNVIVQGLVSSGRERPAIAAHQGQLRRCQCRECCSPRCCGPIPQRRGYQVSACCGLRRSRYECRVLHSLRCHRPGRPPRGTRESKYLQRPG